MKWIALIFKTMMSNRRRSLLTMGSISLALFMFISLQTVNHAMNVKIETGKQEVRLAILDHNGDLHNPLPISYLDDLSRMEHVEAVTPVCLTVLSPGNEQNKVFLTMAVDPDEYRRVFKAPAENFPPEQYESFRQTKNGLLVGRDILERSGWRVGDVVRLKSMPDKFELDFVICGVYVNKNQANKQMESQILMHYGYYDETKGRLGKVNFFWAKVDGKNHEKQVIRGIAAHFADASTEVAVETEGSMLSKMNQLTEFMRQVIRVISIMVMGTIFVVVVNSIALSMRERTREIAVMKAIGFTPRSIQGLILGESVMLTLAAGVLGTAAAYALFASANLSITTILTFNFVVKTESIFQGILISFALGAFGGAIPAYLASRVKVIAALRSL